MNNNILAAKMKRRVTQVSATAACRGVTLALVCHRCLLVCVVLWLVLMRRAVIGQNKDSRDWPE